MPSLDRLISSARREVEERRGSRPLAELQQAARDLDPIRPFTEAIGGEEISFVLRDPPADPEILRVAVDAEVAGLAAGGEALHGLAHATTLPILDTDVIVDPYQLYESRLAGADGVALIAAAFQDEDDRLTEMHAVAVSLGLDVVLEVDDEEEIDRLLDLLDPDSFLIRNRGPEGAVDFERTFRLLEEVPAGKVVLSRGGVRTREQVGALERAGVDAAILGPWVFEQGVMETLRVLRGDQR